MISSALIYSVRFGPKIALPEAIIASIAKLRTVPATYRPIRQVKSKYTPRAQDESTSWRVKAIVECIRRVRETEDAQYDDMFGIFNKVTASNLEVLSSQAIAILKSRDEQFRLRVTTLLFDKAIKGSAYAGIMADLAVKLNAVFSDVSDDLETHVQMFQTLYDMSETLVFPKVEEPDFNDKVIAWAKQKDIRRGYARFLTHLYTRELVSGQALQESMQKVLVDLNDAIVQPKSEQVEENVTQFADFIFEIAKLLKPTAVELRGLIQTRVDDILKRPRTDFPSLNMRSRFKLEDALKCVKAC
jgi:hypothetical protein